jgi:hypothetical protein
MIPEPSARLTRGTCPCCSAENVRLYPCLGCDWAAATGRRESKERLDQFRPGSARNAYNPTGCRVCDACRRQMSQCSTLCPLRLFHDLGQAKTTHQAGVHAAPGWFAGPSEAICAQWERWLAERGWPEITEGFWHRLLTFLQAERDNSQRRE